MNQTQVISLPLSQLIKAAWNYKTEGTPEQIAKLAASILRDHSAGVLAVREIEANGKTVYEVIDGNHRLEAIRTLQWQAAQCENFGKISQAEAVLVARRRNHLWFEDDVLKYSELFTTIVLPQIPISDLESFMPESRMEMESLGGLLKFDWGQFTKNKDEAVNDKSLRTLSLKIPSEVYALWTALKEHLQTTTTNDAEIFSFALRSVLKQLSTQQK